MELNREQAIDILDKFDFFQGQRAGRELWNNKPFDVQEQDIANFSKDVALLKGYIKELTEENERLKLRVLEENHLRKQAEEMLANGMSVVKADTVRKMQKLIKERCIKGGIYPAFVARTIEQIAKEMWEGTE